MQRFFVSEEPKGEALLGGDTRDHMEKSLRMRPGERLVLTAGTGRDFLCTLLRFTEDGALVRVDSVCENATEPKTLVTLNVSFLKGDRLEFVAQKAVELGVFAIRPVLSRRCVSRPDDEALAKKSLRLKKIIKEAAQQCGRGIIPRLLGPADLKTALAESSKRGETFFFYECGEGSLKSALRDAGGEISVFTGPEGGYEPQEAETAKAFGAKILTLGSRILRAETAPLAALSAIFYDKGEWEI